jgi:hypothetical protein
MSFVATLPPATFSRTQISTNSFYTEMQRLYDSGPVPFTLARTSATSWRATFDRPVLNSPPLTIPACYVFSPSLEVKQLQPNLNGLGQATYVDIITLEQGPFTYTLTIHGTESA